MSLQRYIGLMSGTSLDGIDCALISIRDDVLTLEDFIIHDLPETLRTRILALCHGDGISITELGELDIELARCFAEAVLHLLDRQQLSHDMIDAIGSHGQTIWHQPSRDALDGIVPFTLQIADPNTIAQRTRITTVADFRRKDMAAGGQGAPLVPAFHKRLLHNPQTDRIILNLGGIANITVLSKDGIIPLQGYDTGPGNVLLDCWIQQTQDRPFDDEGAWAASGQCHAALLAHLLAEPYFMLPPPKSTGRELFNADWLTEKLRSFGESISPADIQATLMMLTVHSIADAVRPIFANGELLICGGGALNRHLVTALAKELPAFTVSNTADYDMPSDAMEAAAFAWMASMTLHKHPIDFTSITGATEPGIAGGVFYYE